MSQVLTIPLSNQFGVDRASWKVDAKGRFSVKSAYLIARDYVIGGSTVSSSTGDPYVAIWRALWKARVPSKVAIFGWRLVQNLLPTRVALTQKGYAGPFFCCVCDSSSETLEHLFRDYEVANKILAASPFNFAASSCSWKDWFLTQAQALSSSLFDRLLIILWSLWDNRNNMLWNQKSKPA